MNPNEMATALPFGRCLISLMQRMGDCNAQEGTILGAMQGKCELKGSRAYAETLMKVGGELRFINDLRRRFPQTRGRGMVLGMGDDCALLAPRAGWRVAVTTDLLVEGRHFRRDTHVAESAGHRCLARGLSDLAAMGGAEPLGAFLSLAMPPKMLKTAADRRWLDGFLQGFEALSRRFKTPLAGGDTGEAPGEELVADLVLVGQVRPERALLRSGARPGDGVWVTGSLGGSAAELEGMLARAGDGRRPSRVRGPQSFPEPRIGVGAALARRMVGEARAVTACLDVSDGLSSDLAQLCEASGVAVRVERNLVPVHPLAMGLGEARALKLALDGGEDYELLFTARAEARLPKVMGGVALTRIGTVLKKSEKRPMMTLVEAAGRERAMERGGWEHLQGPKRR